MATTPIIPAPPGGGGEIGNFEQSPRQPPGTDMTGICFRDQLWLNSYPLDRNLVFDYFALSPFYDWTCSNEQLRMNSTHPLDISHLSKMTGMEYMLTEVVEPNLFVIKKQKRDGPEKVTPILTYYVLDGTIYQAPQLCSVFSSRIEYSDLLHEFMTAVKQIYGEKVLVQFEDFANHNAFDLLAKYSPTHLVFNDDIQGTASVVLAGLISALKLVGGSLANHKFLFLGAGEAGTGIAELIALEISKHTNTPVEETRKNIWLVDSKGLIVSSRKESLQHFKKPWAHEPVRNLIDAVKAIKPTVLIGSSGAGRTFTKEVVETMASLNKRPVILALSNPTSQCECTAEQAYTWSQGRAIFASGSPFPPVEFEGKTFTPGQANNAYIFPGFGLGLIMSGAIRVHEDMLLAASEALASQVTEENYKKGLIYPPFTNIRKISARIAASVAAKAYELGMATRLPQPQDLVKYAESCMYSPSYRNYR